MNSTSKVSTPNSRPIVRKAVQLAFKDGRFYTFDTQELADTFLQGMKFLAQSVDVTVPAPVQTDMLEWDMNYESAPEYPDYIPFPGYFVMSLEGLARVAASGVEERVRTDARVTMIKAVREHTGFSLKNAKDIVDMLFVK